MKTALPLSDQSPMTSRRFLHNLGDVEKVQRVACVGEPRPAGLQLSSGSRRCTSPAELAQVSLEAAAEQKQQQPQEA